MGVRILPSGAIKPKLGKPVQSETGRLKLRMLTGEDQRRRNSPGIERLCDRGELDRFGTSADDDNNTVGQPSP